MIPFFFFNDTATTEIYTLSLHDALPICQLLRRSPFANQLDEPLPELRRVRPMALRHRGRSFPPQPWGVHETGSTPDDLGRPGAVALSADLDDVTGHRRHHEPHHQRDGENRCQPSSDFHVALLVSDTTGSNAPSPQPGFPIWTHVSPPSWLVNGGITPCLNSFSLSR